MVLKQVRMTRICSSRRPQPTNGTKRQNANSNSRFKQRNKLCIPQRAKDKTRMDTKNSEYDQEIPQSQTADKPMATQERATQQIRDTRKTN